MEFVQEFDTDMWVRSCQYLFQFLTYSFGADYMNILSKLNNSPSCILMNGKIKTARKTGGSYHAQLVFCKSFDGISDGTDDAFRNVLLSANIIKYLILYRIVKQTIDGEAPPFYVIFGGAESNIIRVTSITIRTFRAKGSHLEVVTVFDNNDHPKLHAYRNGLPKEVYNVLGKGAGGNVVINRYLPHNHIAYTPTGKEGFIAVFLQGFY